jgi:hypothetical protein
MELNIVPETLLGTTLYRAYFGCVRFSTSGLFDTYESALAWIRRQASKAGVNQ